MLENNCDTKQQFVVYLGEVFFLKITITCLPMTMHRLVKGNIVNNKTITAVFEFNNM